MEHKTNLIGQETQYISSSWCAGLKGKQNTVRSSKMYQGKSKISSALVPFNNEHKIILIFFKDEFSEYLVNISN